MKKRRYKFEVKKHNMPTIEEILFFQKNGRSCADLLMDMPFKNIGELLQC